jgi:hypothetical protein
LGWKKASALNLSLGIGDQALLPSRSISQSWEGFTASPGNLQDIPTIAMGIGFDADSAGMIDDGIRG